jgi:hypothetical protein
MSVVYWVRLKEHTDITINGYVGVAISFDERMARHLLVTTKLDCHFSSAIIKYGWDNLIKEIVFEGSQEDCFKKEIELRPSFQIGWNEAPGGLGGDRSRFIDYKNRQNNGWCYDKTRERNPFWDKNHTQESLKKMSFSQCKHIITTPDGMFNGFREVARFYRINKITAKLWCGKKEGWSYESK